MHKESNLFKLFRAQSNSTVFYVFSTSVSCLKSHCDVREMSTFIIYIMLVLNNTKLIKARAESVALGRQP